MSIGISKDKLIEVVGGRGNGSAERIMFQGAEFDSRRIRGGELFVALKGEREHGHCYVEKALQQGASLCLVEDAALLESASDPARLVAVDDTLRSFSDLAHWWRKQTKVPVAGVTGSMGKTTVKELTASILLKHSRGTYAFKSFNNHVGVPYTLCGISPEHEWVVLEMGMNHAGELSALSHIAAPDVAAIIGVGTVHMHVFAGVSEIADAKCEIMDGMAPQGTLVINGDDACLEAAVQRKGEKGRRPLRRAGYGEGCDARVMEVTSLGLEGLRCKINLCGEELEFKTPLLGKHNAYNCAVAALTAKTLVPSLSGAEIKEGLSRFIPPRMRLNIRRINPSRVVVDDSYNANPPAMRALFALAAELGAQQKSVGLVLGDMRELGGEAPRYHQEVAADAVRLKPSFIIAVGEYAHLYGEEGRRAGVKVFEAASPQAAAHTAHKLPFEILFVKASRGIGLDRTVETLLEIEGEIPPEQSGGAAPAE
jgi:UDP-N-acetylmuramoyl-tripeptide--D-alanyl-D-alanine ligase